MTRDGIAELLDEFLLEARERVSRLETILLSFEQLADDERGEALVTAKRELHTLKGNSGMMGFEALQRLAHHLEDLLAEARTHSLDVDEILTGLDRFAAGLDEVDPRASKPETEAVSKKRTSPGVGSVRIAHDRLDDLVDLTAELVILRNRLSAAITAGATLNPKIENYAEHAARAWRHAEESLQTIEKALDSVQREILGLRMVPLRSIFHRLTRVVHDESARLKRKVELVTVGEETPIERSLIEVAGDVLGHLVRNAIIHGIEPPAERRRLGKPESGTVHVQAVVRGGIVQIDVVDDGAGIDEDALRVAAHGLGIPPAEVADLHSLVFHPGLSARHKVDIGSGRGMGTSAVLDATHRAGGVIDLLTEPGVGTLLRLQLPLSVSIADGLLLDCDAELYALPVATVIETVRFGDANASLDGEGTLRWRDQDIATLDLGCHFGTRSRRRSSGFAVITEVESRVTAILIDRLAGMQEIVVKPLDLIVGAPAGIAGTTVLGDGKVIMILDPSTLATDDALLARTA